MTRGGVRHTLTVYLLIGCISCLPSAFFRDLERYEGDRCKLANNQGDGVCRKLFECPQQEAAVEEGNYNTKDRCSFVGLTEIVCCGSVETRNKPNNRTGQWQADAACAEYSNEVLQSESTKIGIGFYITGGEDAKSSEFPYMAALGYNNTSPSDDGSVGLRYTCGGTLITRNHVLTAAHCVSNYDKRVPVQVKLGSINLNGSDDSVQDVDVVRATAHPEFKLTSNYHDIAILTLRTPVRLTPSVRPACLLTRLQTRLNPAENETLVVVGWGYTSIEFEETQVLRKAAGLTFVDNNTCDAHYKNDRATRLSHGVDGDMLCVIDQNTTRRADTCSGDSGGPLLLYSGSMYKLAGVTAFGKACGSIVPSVYMSVFSYMDWIEQQISRTEQ